MKKQTPSEIISVIEKSLSGKEKKESTDILNQQDYGYEGDYTPGYAKMLDKAAETNDESLLIKALYEAIREYRSLIPEYKRQRKAADVRERQYQKNLKNGLPGRRRLVNDMPAMEGSILNPDIYTSILGHSSEGKLLTFFGQHDVSIFDVDPKNVIKLNLIDDTLEIQE